MASAEQVLLGTENDPSFLSQLLTLQNGTGLDDGDIVFHRRHLGFLSLPLYPKPEETSGKKMEFPSITVFPRAGSPHTTMTRLTHEPIL